MEITCSICGKNVTASDPCNPMHTKTADLVEQINEGVLLTPDEIEIIHLMLKGNDVAALGMAEELGWVDANGEAFDYPESEARDAFVEKMAKLGCDPPWID